MTRRKRTIYFNDARHYYLFVFEPPLALEDAWRPVDEVASTGIDTLVFGVARADGLFFPTRTGKLFYSHVDDIDDAIYWKVRQNILSLQDRGLDLLQVLADRAHEKAMEFFVSFRMGTYEGVGSAAADPSCGGRGLAEPEARENQLKVFEEIVDNYDLEGLELDFSGHPGGMPPVLRDEDVEEYMPLITDHVRRISERARAAGKQVGVRVPCSANICASQGADVATWLSAGLVDYVVPMVYANLRIDTQMPIEWIINAASAADISVYGMLQPFYEDGFPGHGYDQHFTPELMRAAAVNFLDRGGDGLYTWFMDWPLGHRERGMLNELASPELMQEADKQYRLPRREASSAALGYGAVLPLEIPAAADRRWAIPIFIADDIESRTERISKVVMRLRIRNTVSADQYTILLNGQSLQSQIWRRSSGAYVRIPVAPHRIEHYSALWLEIELNQIRPRRGDNLIEVVLEGRPPKLKGGVTIDDLEINIEYSPFIRKQNP